MGKALKRVARAKGAKPKPARKPPLPPAEPVVARPAPNEALLAFLRENETRWAGRPENDLGDSLRVIDDLRNGRIP
jgi:hypothetical protein